MSELVVEELLKLSAIRFSYVNFLSDFREMVSPSSKSIFLIISGFIFFF